MTAALYLVKNIFIYLPFNFSVPEDFKVPANDDEMESMIDVTVE